METWTRWPHATATPELLIVEHHHEGHLPVLGHRPGLMLRPGGRRGISYPLAPHEACWRSFADILRDDIVPMNVLPHHMDEVSPDRLIDVPRLLRFVRHYGPLQLTGEAGEPFSTSTGGIAGILQSLAKHWDRPKRLDVMSYRLPDTEVPEDARRMVYHATVYLAHILSDLAERHSLVRFMFESALRHISQDMPMTHCRACGMWIAVTRSDRQFCDGACRQANAPGRGKRGRRQVVGGN